MKFLSMHYLQLSSLFFIEFIHNGIHSNIIKQIYVQYKFAIKNYVTK